MKDIFKSRYTGYIIFGIILALVPTLQSFGLLQSSTVTVLGTVMFYAIVGVGLNVLMGYSGLTSLGTAGFMGTGAYLAAYFTQDMGLGFFASTAIAVAVPLAIGLVIGLISLRLEGYYLAIATLSVAEILRQVFIEFETVTGGFSGKKANYPELFNMIELDRQGTFILIAIILVVILILTDNFINGSTGRALLTMRGSEAAAQAMGINLLKYKLMAFAVATLYAGLGGVLYVHFIRYAYPSGWDLMLSLQILAVIVIGGMRTITGPVIGAFVVFGIPELFLKKLPVIGNIDGLALIFTGILIIGIIMFYPNGLIHIKEDFKKLMNRKKNKEVALDE